MLHCSQVFLPSIASCLVMPHGSGVLWLELGGGCKRRPLHLLSTVGFLTVCCWRWDLLLEEGGHDRGGSHHLQSEFRE